MQVYTNAKDLTINIFCFHFGERSNMSKPILLLLDDFSGPWTREVIEYAKDIDIALMKVPLTATSMSQPADATWYGPLKVRPRNKWIWTASNAATWGSI
ncbi:Hypothetical protein PHPALM_6132 [Phytophthora palmivora]|uniref:DDE-1 domain-containing protein n=1 Tax=Phytophthora palmivora TaxID=4796 RepID=A0A2P4YFM9_9STRA|nr:Hypothetical protein PHPALM_6132 [Phytophthora palmivora]